MRPLCPKGLTGTEWLVAQGARTELPRYRSGSVNPELSSNLLGWGMRTELPVQEDDAADWQSAYGEHRREKLQAASFDQDVWFYMLLHDLRGTGVKHICLDI